MNNNFLSVIKNYVLNSSLINNVYTNVSCDSRKINANVIFCCTKKNKSFWQQSYQTKTLIITEEENIRTPFIQVSDVELCYDLLLKFFHPQVDKIQSLAFTGTNGKSTSLNFLNHICNYNNIDIGQIGTVSYKYKTYYQEAKLTTPNQEDLYQIYSEWYNNSCRIIAMEASAHGIEQKRLGTIKFKGACFLNLSQDHFDYFKDFDTYFNAKKQLFYNIEENGYAFICIDDKYGKILYKELQQQNIKLISFGYSQESQVQLSSYQHQLTHATFNLKYKDEMHTVQIPLIGKHNSLNACASILMANAINIPFKNACKSLKHFINDFGRLEKIHTNKGHIFIDYSHTPDALEKSLATLKEFNKKIIIVFGCGGKRDRQKRPIMGKVADTYSDIIILCDDNPRDENPINIIDDIASGIINKDKIFILHQRKDAIKKAINLIDEETIVLIAGKGHEKVQYYNNKIIFHNDKKATLSILNND